MKLIKLLSLTMSVFSMSVFAHAGHDHSDPSALFIHLLWLAPIAIAGVIAFKYTSSKKQQDSQE